MGSPAGVMPTHTLSQDQRRAKQRAKGMQDSENHGAMTIDAQDIGREAGYVIYIYNLLSREYVIQQPPLFPGLIIPACKRGEKVSYTIVPAFVKEPYCKPGTTEFYYKEIDGRKCATSLLNPAAFPGTDWNSQLQNWESEDQYGNNLNVLGCWWSLTMPHEEERLDREIKLFRERVDNTMNALIRRGEELSAAGDLKNITPLMHFAMDYLGKQAVWHMTSRHMVICPNCGDTIQEGIAYHRNAFGDRCIIDRPRYYLSIGEVDPAATVAAKPTSEPSVADPGQDPQTLNSASGANLAKRSPKPNAGKKEKGVGGAK